MKNTKNDQKKTLCSSFICAGLSSAALHLSPKVKVKTLSVLTGTPSRVAGLKTHWLAAAVAAGRSIIGPLMAVALTTRPASEMTTCTSTFPATPLALAAGGETGLVDLLTLASIRCLELCIDRVGRA